MSLTLEHPRLDAEDATLDIVWLEDTADGLDAFVADARAPSPSPDRVAAPAAATASRFEWLRRAAPAMALCAMAGVFTDGLPSPWLPAPHTLMTAPSAPAPVAAAGVTMPMPTSSAPAAPAAPAANVTTRAQDVYAIQVVLGRYRSAFDRLDASAAAAVWPSVNRASLARAFDGMDQQRMIFTSCQIDVVDVLAQVNCRGTTRHLLKGARRAPPSEARGWTFSLRKDAGAWTIERIDPR